eukprot:maker-scaffold1169_size57682-snap-gene-0.10 protein:Tk06058 transcript:maker-scaffold1169_size57682-snap-gene-0.10-mRNA-1 annotation:"hypothetical protein DAPPUDRAFT_252666"
MQKKTKCMRENYQSPFKENACRPCILNNGKCAYCGGIKKFDKCRAYGRQCDRPLQPLLVRVPQEESSLVVDGKCSKNHAVISNEAAVHAGGSTPEARMVFSDATGHKIELASQPLTTDLTPWGRFCWLRAPMDLASSGGEFCKRGDGALQGIPGTIKEVDDILAKVEAELQAIVWGVNKCRLYLAGLGHILIISDHKPLKAICNRTSYEANKNTQIQRMLEKLCPYYFTVEWKAGSTIV